MQPSGEVGRFEMVDLPSPPADRHRSSARTMDSIDNETWIVETGDAVMLKKARVGMNGLSPWEVLEYCVWIADHGMRNAGDLETAQDIYSGFHLDGRRIAALLTLQLTHAAFTLEKGDLESQYFVRFDAMIKEIRGSRAASLVNDS